ncbi:MAG: YhcB family protein [Proteobacteria bacterium]|nr:YhcB family protein [Pseudomonadota bacterium]
MDYAISVWQITIIALVAGAMIGGLVYRLFSPSVKQAEKIKTDLYQVRGELASYKASVRQHFEKTSELVNDLTQNYVRVYQHLAEGAQTLGDNKAFPSLLEQHQGKISIAIDDTSNAVSDDSRFDPAVTELSSSEPVDEHAESFNSQGSEEPDPENLANDSTKTVTENLSDNLDNDAEGVEAVPSVDATEALTEKAHSRVVH